MIEYSMEVLYLLYFRTQTYMHALFCIVDYLRTRYDTVQYSILSSKVLSKVLSYNFLCVRVRVHTTVHFY